MGFTPLHWNTGVIAELNVRRAVVRAYELDDVGKVVNVNSGLFGVVLEYLVQSHADNIKPVGSCKSKLLQVVVDSFEYSVLVDIFYDAKVYKVLLDEASFLVGPSYKNCEEVVRTN